MNSKIVVTQRGDFGHDWNLVVETHNGVKNFYLGQDVKFCSRVLGMSPREVVNEIGTGDFRNEDNLVLLGNFITERLGLHEDSNVDEMNTWDLCCQ